jgi:2-polyprenyl-3-methyl-5-hydroxy-6-metoxy-1,4-benzoquinol methylase
MICSTCGQVMTPFLEARDYNHGVSDKTFRYERCRHCGLVSLDNIPSELGLHYSAEYHEIPASVADLERNAERERYKIDLVTRFASGGRLLEIGSSWGGFCLLAQRAGFAVDAIEMDQACCEFLRTKLGVRAIRSADPAAAMKEAASPDVITLWQVLEHMRKPWKVLEAASRKLAVGGVLLVSTPNPEAVQFKIFGRFWAHLDAPRHTHLVPSALLQRRMAALGLQTELITTTDAGSLGCNDFGWRCSIANVSPFEFSKRPLRLAGRLIGNLAAPLDRARGKGSAYTAVFRKRANK